CFIAESISDVRLEPPGEIGHPRSLEPKAGAEREFVVARAIGEAGEAHERANVRCPHACEGGRLSGSHAEKRDEMIQRSHLDVVREHAIDTFHLVPAEADCRLDRPAVVEEPAGAKLRCWKDQTHRRLVAEPERCGGIRSELDGAATLCT